MKERLDVLLVENGLSESREKAKAVIMAGQVYVNGQKEDKAGQMFPVDAEITVRGKTLPYVSRGGLKLEKALSVFSLSVKDRICMDVGASTGGFTDCLLMNGAAKVYAVDVGYGQLHYKLRNDPRVVNMEKTNIRYLTPEEVPDRIDFATVDVSFISLTKVLVPLRNLLAEEADVAALIKPQFEAGREKVGKKGVVRDPAVHEEVIDEVASFAEGNGYHIKGLTFSPIKGPEGNIEYLIWLQKTDAFSDREEKLPIKEVVAEAHKILSSGKGS